MPAVKDTAPEPQKPTDAPAKEEPKDEKPVKAEAKEADVQVRFPNRGIGVPADQLPFVGVDPNRIHIPSEVGGQPFVPAELQAALDRDAELEARSPEADDEGDKPEE